MGICWIIFRGLSGGWGGFFGKWSSFRAESGVLGWQESKLQISFLHLPKITTNENPVHIRHACSPAVFLSFNFPNFRHGSSHPEIHFQEGRNAQHQPLRPVRDDQRKEKIQAGQPLPARLSVWQHGHEVSETEPVERELGTKTGRVSGLWSRYPSGRHCHVRTIWYLRI